MLLRSNRRGRRAAKLDRHRDRLRPCVSDYSKMQMGPGGEARIAGVGDIFATLNMLAGLNADGIPMQMRVDRDRAIIVQDLYHIGLIRHHGAGGTAETVMPQINDRTITCCVHRSAVG